MSDWEALGREVRRRRAQLRLRQTDLESRGGPSAGTMRNIEQANREAYAPRTFVQLETGLDWPDGVVAKILDGTATREEIDATAVRRISARTAVQDAIGDDDLANRVGRAVLDAADEAYIRGLLAERPPLTPEQIAVLLRVLGNRS